MPVTLKNRIPLIVGALPHVVEPPIKAGCEAIAADAATRAPTDTEALEQSIQAREGTFTVGGRSEQFTSVAKATDTDMPTGQRVEAFTAYGIWAAWYWFFLEFGTVKMSPRPFMMPAYEDHKDEIVAGVQAALGAL